MTCESDESRRWRVEGKKRDAAKHVPVDDFMSMTVADGLAELREGDARLPLRIVLPRQYAVKQLAAATQVQHHEEVVGRQVAVVEADDVRVVEAPQSLNLVLERGDVVDPF